MQAADTDKSGTINYTEFIAATMDAQIFMREENLRNAFVQFNKDGSGMISPMEIQTLLEEEEFKNHINKDQLYLFLSMID